MCIINVNVQNKAPAKSLHCYIEATIEFEPFQMDMTYLPQGTIPMDHGSYQEYCYNNMLVVADNITQAVVCNDRTAQQEQV